MHSSPTDHDTRGRDAGRYGLATLLGTAGLVLGAVVLALALRHGGPLDGQATVEAEFGPGPTADSGTLDSGTPDSATAGSASEQPTTIQVADPIAIRIPAIDVDAATTPLGVRADGTIEVPADFQETGWWRDGPEPGEIGPAVILGHVDSRDGPAVFFSLSKLTVGDPIHVDRADGSTVTYVVERIEQHAKDAFPTSAVYGPTDRVELRLVTCGGTFDRNARSYVDNVIVFASAA